MRKRANFLTILSRTASTTPTPTPRCKEAFYPVFNSLLTPTSGYRLLLLSIHLFSFATPPALGGQGQEPAPAVLSRRRGFTLDKGLLRHGVPRRDKRLSALRVHMPSQFTGVSQLGFFSVSFCLELIADVFKFIQQHKQTCIKACDY